MKLLLIPNAFKGTLTNSEVSQILKEELLAFNPNLDISSLPFCDGGDGTIASFEAVYGSTSTVIELTVQGPDKDQKVNARYLLIGDSAIIETAQACGYVLTKVKNPFFTSTYGVGEIIKDAMDKGAKNIYLCLGGTATNDLGCGMMKALGVNFYTQDGKKFLPLGKNLGQVHRIDLSEMDKRIQTTNFKILSDVDSPLLGKKGASFVYGKQKGCPPDKLWILEKEMRKLSVVLKDTFQIDDSKKPGAGAGGGLGLACFLYLKGSLISGGQFFLDLPLVREKIKEADFIITGEGHIDKQTFEGKGVYRILHLLKETNDVEKKQLMIIAPLIDADAMERLKEEGVDYVYPIRSNIRNYPKERRKEVAVVFLRRGMQEFFQLHPTVFACKEEAC